MSILLDKKEKDSKDVTSTIYKCRICGKEFISIPEVIEHEQTCAKESIEKFKKEQSESKIARLTKDINDLKTEKEKLLKDSQNILNTYAKNKDKIEHINTMISDKSKLLQEAKLTISKKFDTKDTYFYDFNDFSKFFNDMIDKIN